MYKVAFRVDGGPHIGMGHIIRCLSLAKEFKKQGNPVYFICREKEGIQKVTKEGINVLQLQRKNQPLKQGTGFHYGNPQDLEEEAKEITKMIKKHGIDMLFIDSYNVTKEYFLEIKPHVQKLAHIDDINQFVYPVDILINGNIGAEEMGYQKYFEDEIMLLGTKYNLIREEFRNLPQRQIRKEVEEIMITTGGSDPFDMTGKILNWLLEDNELKRLTYNVVVGNGFKNKDRLKEISKENTNVVLHENVKYMSEIMLKSDIAISAGGSTLYELCACGTPTLAFIMADNQESTVRKMKELNYIKSLGWFNTLTYTGLVNNLKKLCADYSTRKISSQYMQKLVDGKGTQRVITSIL